MDELMGLVIYPSSLERLLDALENNKPEIVKTLLLYNPSLLSFPVNERTLLFRLIEEKYDLSWMVPTKETTIAVIETARYLDSMMDNANLIFGGLLLVNNNIIIQMVDMGMFTEIAHMRLFRKDETAFIFPDHLAAKYWTIIGESDYPYMEDLNEKALETEIDKLVKGIYTLPSAIAELFFVNANVDINIVFKAPAYLYGSFIKYGKGTLQTNNVNPSNLQVYTYILNNRLEYVFFKRPPLDAANKLLKQKALTPNGITALFNNKSYPIDREHFEQILAAVDGTVNQPPLNILTYIAANAPTTMLTIGRGYLSEDDITELEKFVKLPIVFQSVMTAELWFHQRSGHIFSSYVDYKDDAWTRNPHVISAMAKLEGKFSTVKGIVQELANQASTNKDYYLFGILVGSGYQIKVERLIISFSKLYLDNAYKTIEIDAGDLFRQGLRDAQ